MDDEAVISQFLSACERFDEFYNKLTMHLYQKEPCPYEYVAVTRQKIGDLQFILSKLLPLVKKAGDLHSRITTNNENIEDFLQYFSEKFPEMKFWTKDFIIHSRILMDDLTLAAVFLLNNDPPKTSSNINKKFRSFTKLRKVFKKDKLCSNFSPEFVLLVKNADWYESGLKNIRDDLIIHVTDAKHRIIGFGSGNSMLDFGFMRAYPTTLTKNTGNGPLLKPLIMNLGQFLNEYTRILEKQALRE